MAKYAFTAVVEQDENGVYISSCPALQGCHSQGDTYEEAIENIKEAIRLHIEARQSLGEPVPVEVAVERVEVDAP
jgi:predicted RNase H-like HicB family nuclease